MPTDDQAGRPKHARRGVGELWGRVSVQPFRVWTGPLMDTPAWVRAGRPYWLLCWVCEDRQGSLWQTWCRTTIPACHTLHVLATCPTHAVKATAGCVIDGTDVNVELEWVEVRNLAHHERQVRAANGGELHHYLWDLKLDMGNVQTFMPGPDGRRPGDQPELPGLVPELPDGDQPEQPGGGEGQGG